MALKNNDPNPLNYFNIRRVNYSPPHFHYYTLQKGMYMIHKLNSWIEYNLHYRYYLGQCLILDHNKTVIYAIKIGFEHEAELMYFLMACPLI